MCKFTTCLIIIERLNPPNLTLSSRNINFWPGSYGRKVCTYLIGLSLWSNSRVRFETYSEMVTVQKRLRSALRRKTNVENYKGRLKWSDSFRNLRRLWSVHDSFPIWLSDWAMQICMYVRLKSSLHNVYIVRGDWQRCIWETGTGWYDFRLRFSFLFCNR
jgi:hypothetical protein